MRRVLKHREDIEYHRGYNDAELEASNLRKDFLRKHVIHFDTNLYKTVVERDWAYICKREYNYDVLGKSVVWGFFWGNVATSARMFMLKRFVIWPLPVVGAAVAWYVQPRLLQKHSKKLFDMCNVGEQYYLGKKRNEVLGECNRILDREDF